MRKEVTAIVLALLVMGTLTLGLEIQPAKANPLSYIYIHSDGSVDPPSAPIQQNADNYTYVQTGDINYYGIIIERSNMTLNGQTHSIIGGCTGTDGDYGNYTGIGVNVTGISHVMLENLTVRKFRNGIAFINSNYCQLYHSDIETGSQGDSASIGVNVTNSAQITLYNDTANLYRHGIILSGSSYNRVFNCTSRQSGEYKEDGWGLDLTSGSNFNDVFDNNFAQNHDGIGITHDDYNWSILTYNNSITYNAIQDNSNAGIEPNMGTGNNTITHNDFVSNGKNANVDQSYNNSWDGGSPTYSNGGNIWSDYNGTYNETTHIGETPYNITSNDKDNFPLELYNYTYKYLTLQSAGNGTTDPPPDTYPIPYPGMNVTITPIPAPAYDFDHWLLDGTTNKTDNPITIAMDSDHTLKAYFKMGGGCPYLSAWNGSGYVLDNNLLPASETGNGTDTRDYYLLQQPLVPMLRTK